MARRRRRQLPAAASADAAAATALDLDALAAVSAIAVMAAVWQFVRALRRWRKPHPSWCCRSSILPMARPNRSSAMDSPRKLRTGWRRCRHCAWSLAPRRLHTAIASADVRIIGRELQTTHVLEGSLRRSGDRVRITVQLIDTRTGLQCGQSRTTRKPGMCCACRRTLRARSRTTSSSALRRTPIVALPIGAAETPRRNGCTRSPRHMPRDWRLRPTKKRSSSTARRCNWIQASHWPKFGWQAPSAIGAISPTRPSNN